MNKTPVSQLQETIVKLKLPIPDYKYNHILCDITKQICFECIVTVGTISAKGTGASKKEAKHKCADELLRKLNFTSEVNKSTTDPPIFLNYVGKLNEFATARRLAFATYETISCDTDKISNTTEFVIKCIFNGFESIGLAFTKKQAKQNAAYQMLCRVEEPNVVSVNNNVMPEYHSVENVIDKYQQLSLQANAKYSTINLTAEKKKMDVEYIENIIKLEELKDLCKKFNICYEIEILSRKDNVILLKQKTTDITILEQGGTYEEALINAFKKLIIISKTLIK